MTTGNSHYKLEDGMKRLSTALQKGPGGTCGWGAGHEAAMCTHCPESQSRPGLHQQKHGQLGKGGDLPFCSVL